MRSRTSSTLGPMLGLLLCTACTDPETGDDDLGAGTEAASDGGTTMAAPEDEETSADGSTTAPTDPPSGPSAADDPACQEDFAFCGDLIVPPDLAGTPRSLGIALYRTVPPAGPPDAVVTEIEAPALVPGERFPIVVVPVLDQGEYYVWVNLYMEGGGMFIPVAGVDYSAVTAEPVELDGTPFSFGALTLSLVE